MKQLTKLSLVLLSCTYFLAGCHTGHSETAQTTTLNTTQLHLASEEARSSIAIHKAADASSEKLTYAPIHTVIYAVIANAHAGTYKLQLPSASDFSYVGADSCTIEHDGSTCSIGFKTGASFADYKLSVTRSIDTTGAHTVTTLPLKTMRAVFVDTTQRTADFGLYQGIETEYQPKKSVERYYQYFRNAGDWDTQYYGKYWGVGSADILCGKFSNKSGLPADSISLAMIVSSMYANRMVPNYEIDSSKLDWVFNANESYLWIYLAGDGAGVKEFGYYGMTDKNGLLIPSESLTIPIARLTGNRDLAYIWTGMRPDPRSPSDKDHTDQRYYGWRFDMEEAKASPIFYASAHYGKVDNSFDAKNPYDTWNYGLWNTNVDGFETTHGLLCVQQ